MARPGSILITLVALVTSVMCYIIEFNETHIYNPRWPPHAKFHGGQTMSMGLVLGLTALFYLYRHSPSAELKIHDLHTATWISSLYWITQLSAFLYPGSAAMDPEFGDGAPQIRVCAVVLTMLGVGLWVERRRLVAAAAAEARGASAEKTRRY
ncbi:uncharacterized protein BJX67DRAFT_379028 [Aspergillus lucknowensis]|uniref:Uncharacterized protein n=1 Tax=Aspergillus lucknowensis TaxID=176173 RepID=A0ABR4LZ59_9EURO